ncbi:uncharacterized protein MJAP1_001273 [Malassezia japonica]|uniref:Post-SET domain-containing protein n=1 Tax=Malassezia japonica TaxID=223818 RepID=A0AAF0J945_9BASI|nr:uncharacterized protein MJAP1_001273 [Malassezia japonica]WFD38322.1 hypothetical protein MJAP1_001273 [Malassezia japonica]
MPTAVALPSSDGTVAAKTHVSTHPDVIRIEFQGGDYNSYAVAARPYRAGEVIATFDHATPSDEVRYSTVQTGEKSHLELNSDLLYCNHSCAPSVEFHVVEGDIRKGYAAAAHDIAEGDTLTFFYPSTEWHMQQPFQCQCGAKTCLGRIAGAESLSNEQLKPYFLNAHIQRLKAQQASS